LPAQDITFQSPKHMPHFFSFFSIPALDRATAVRVDVDDLRFQLARKSAE
jgi:hypothetical protein